MTSMAVLPMHIPGTRVRGGGMPDVVHVMYWPLYDEVVPGEPNPSGERVSLLGRMEGFPLSCQAGGGYMEFTVEGWQAFVAAVKAGEFDGILDAG